MALEKKVINVFECKCLRCGYEWTSTKDNNRPSRCPKCLRKFWWTPRKNKSRKISTSERTKELDESNKKQEEAFKKKKVVLN